MVDFKCFKFFGLVKIKFVVKYKYDKDKKKLWYLVIVVM